MFLKRFQIDRLLVGMSRSPTQADTRRSVLFLLNVSSIG